MNPLFVKIGVGIGVGVLFSAAALLILLLGNTKPPLYRHEFTGSYMKDDATATYMCCVCLEDFNTTDQNKLFKLPCGHKFHRPCLKKWFEEQRVSRSCPYCRRSIEENVVSLCL